MSDILAKIWSWLGCSFCFPHFPRF